MSAVIPVDRMYGIGVVVTDLDKATVRLAEILGIDDWEVREYGDEHTTDIVSAGRPVSGAEFRSAVGSTTPQGPDDLPVTFELVQPLRGESPFLEFAFKRRQGIMFQTVKVMNEAEFAELMKRLEPFGVTVAYSFTVDGRMRRVFLDTRAALGGYYLEIRVPLDGSEDHAIAPTSTWNHADRYTRPDDVEPFTVQRIHHFGVVVNDTLATIRRTYDLLGLNSWNMMNWQAGAGSLDKPFYRGEDVDHAYFTSMGFIADWGLEIIQPTHGPQHYRDEFRNHWGEGIHHLLLSRIADQSRWDRTIEWLSSIGAPLVMGSELMNGASVFCYHDTMADTGFILEGVLTRTPPKESPIRWTIDFAQLTNQL